MDRSDQTSRKFRGTSVMTCLPTLPANGAARPCGPLLVLAAHPLAHLLDLQVIELAELLKICEPPAFFLLYLDAPVSLSM
jgi:hypothetical protein